MVQEAFGLIDPVVYANRLQRLGLIENPYLDYPDGRYFFPLVEQRIVYQEMLSLIAQKPSRNISLILADPRMGQSALARRVAGTAAANHGLNAYSELISGESGNITPAKMVKQICASLEIEASTHNERLQGLRERLLADMERYGRSLFVTVDGEITPEALQTIRLMADWLGESPPEAGHSGQGPDKSLLQFALFGRKSSVFYQELQLPMLFPMTHTVRVLGMPSIQELADLIERQAQAAGRSQPLFTNGAVDLLVEQSHRVVGRLMNLAARALHALILSNDTVINERVVRSVTGGDEPPEPARQAAEGVGAQV